MQQRRNKPRHLLTHTNSSRLIQLRWPAAGVLTHSAAVLACSRTQQQGSYHLNQSPDKAGQPQPQHTPPTRRGRPHLPHPHMLPPTTR